MTEELWRQKVLEELGQISHLLTMLLAQHLPVHPPAAAMLGGWEPLCE